jgi:hypothetical protein
MHKAAVHFKERHLPFLAEYCGWSEGQQLLFLIGSFFRFACSSNALISSTSALYLPEAISLAIKSNDFFSTGTVKFLNMVLDAIVLFFQLIKKSYFLRLLRIT